MFPLYLKSSNRDFPGRPVVKTLCFQRKGLGFDPWSGNYIPQHSQKKKKKKIFLWILITPRIKANILITAYMN